MDPLAALIIILLAPLPIVEMRLSVVLGMLRYDLGPAWTFALTAAANVLAIPLIWSALPPLERLCRRSPRMGGGLDWLFAKARRETGKGKEALEEVGLFLVVALTGLPVPIPGSGLYTATVAAYVFGLRLGKAMPWMAAGTVVAVGALVLLVLGGQRLLV